MSKILEILIQFFTLGLISFGGPVAHVGYFHKTFVEKRKWLNDEAYARLLSLSQLLPGPGSSQMGFAIGLHRGGILGGFCAFLAFTTPSFLLMYFLSTSQQWLGNNPWFLGIVNGLKLLAVVVVADATLKMFHKFCTSKRAIAIAVLTAVFLLMSASLINQIMVLVLAAVAGVFLYQAKTDKPQQLSKLTEQQTNVQHQVNSHIGKLPLSLFFGLLIALSFITFHNQWLLLFAKFYQAGSLVFGGGHVVLPLLEQILGDSITNDRFLMGYAAAQAVPGPMFSLGAFLGAELSPKQPFLGALIASAGIFLPGFLLVIALHGSWENIAQKPKVAGMVWGINACVVGLLMTALYNPVFVSAVTSPVKMALALLGFFALTQLNIKIFWLVLIYAITGIVLAL